jgi:hypothetical protein
MRKNVGLTPCLRSACAAAVRRQRILRAPTVEPTDRDHFAAMLAIDNAIAVAVTLRRLSAHAFDETLLRAMMVNVNPYATAMVMITNAGFQKRSDDGRRNGTLGGATGCML